MIVPKHERDGRPLLWAGLTAIGLHVMMLTLLPLPASPKPIRQRPPDPAPITRTALPPPPMPERTAPAAPIERRRPVPMTDAPEFDPWPVPSTERSVSPVEFDGPTLGVDTIAPPPAVPAVHDESRDGLVLPRRTAGQRPTYPEMARLVRAEGTVVLRVVVDEDGRVSAVEVVAAPNPDAGFSRAAVEAVSSWVYEAGQLGERPVSVALKVVVNFELRP